MMQKPEISRESARQVLRSQFPSVDASSIELLGEGWDFRAFVVDGRWIFRFPKSRESEQRLLTELRFLEDVAALLPLSVPRYLFCGTPAEWFPYHFAGYAMLPGTPAMSVELSHSALIAVAVQLGRFLGSLHRFEVAHAISLGLRSCIDDDTIRAAREGALTDLASVRQTVDDNLYQRCATFLRDDSRLPPEDEGPLRVLHNDLGDEHVLVQAETGVVTGVIDWTDAAVGDPALDFARLWAWQGEAFTKVMLDEYGLPADPLMLDRIRYRGVCTAVGTLFYGWRSGDDQYCNSGLAWLRRIFSEA